MPIDQPSDLFSFLLIDLDFHAENVGLWDVLLHLCGYVFKLILVQAFLPVLLPQREPWANCMSLVNVLRAVIERAPKSSHDNILLLPKDKIFFTVDLKPYINLASVEV